jgi:hypothetical protein
MLSMHLLRILFYKSQVKVQSQNQKTQDNLSLFTINRLLELLFFKRINQ